MNNTTGSENGTLVLFDLFSSTEKIIGYSLAYGILCSVALFGNILVLIVVLMNKSMRTTINVLLVNLSISDILFIVLSVPGFLAAEICNNRWLLGLGMAIISHLFVILCAAASVFTLMAIAFERYFAVVHPLKDRTRNKKCATISALVVIWLCSTAFALPFGIDTKLQHITFNVKENGQIRQQEVSFLDLDMDLSTFKIYYVSIFVGLHVVPFLALVMMYTRIAWTLWHPRRRSVTEWPAGDGGNEHAARINERNRRRTTIMVIAVLLAFFVCFFPFHIYFINKLFEPGHELKTSDESSILRVVLLLNAALNPIIYNLLSENFRAGFRGILACWPRARIEISAVGTIDSMNTLQNVGH